MKKAKDYEECKECQYAFTKEKDLFCYMFKDKPNVIPCKQHDKFIAERKIMSMLFKKYPIQMKFMLNVMVNDNNLSHLTNKISDVSLLTKQSKNK